MNARHIIKRIVRSITISAILALAALCLFACNPIKPNKPNTNDDPCANGHKYSEEWNYDTTHHWHDAICEHKGEKSAYAPHSYPDGSDDCSVCDYSRAVSYLSYLTFTKDRYSDSYSVKGSRKDIDTIVIPSEYKGLPVTSIDNFGFQTFVNLKRIVIPDSVTNIGIHTFSGCSALEDVTLPSGITTIGSNAFFGCTSLISIKIPETVTTIDTYAFSDCNSLMSFTVNEKITSIRNSAFNNCLRLVEVFNLSALDIQCGSTDHGSVALYARAVYDTADAKSRVASKDGFLYYSDDDGALLLGYNGESKDVVLPVTLDGNTYTINTRAFANADITSIKITSGVTSIGKEAFYYCQSLESIELDGVREIGEYAFNNCKNLSSVKFSDSLETIGECAFLYCSALTELNVPDSVTKISEGAFAYCSKLEKITVPFVGMEKSTDGKYDSDRVFGIIFGYDVRESTGNGVLQYSVKVGYKTNYYMYHIPSTLSTVIVTGDCVVPSNAFINCSMIKALDLSECTVNAEALAHCYGMETLKTPLTAHIGALFGTEQYYGMTAIKVGSLTYYVPNALTSITICGKTVPNSALYCCEKIETVKFAKTIEAIRYNAFYGCTSLLEIDIPESVTAIEESAFSGCTSLKTAAIRGKVARINGSLFYNCSALTEVNLPIIIESIGDNAFYGCTKLATIRVMPPFLKSIGNNAFYGTAITSLKLQSGLLTIGNNAFGNCTGLTEVTVPDTVTSIGSGAFSGCKSITEITVPFIGGKLYDSDDVYNNYPFGYIFGSYSYDGGKATKQRVYGRTTGSETTYYVPTSLKKVTVKSGAVFGSAFMNCDGLTEINFPTDITEIGGYAFYNCAALAQLVVPSGVTEIGEYALYGLTSVAYNEYQNGLYLGSIENNYMVLCGVKDKTAATFTINSGTRILCEEAISGMTAITSFSGIPSGVKRLPEKAMYNCSELTDVTIPDTVEYIACGAISYCGKLTNISLPYLGDSLKTDEDDYRYPLGYIFGIDKYPSVSNSPKQEYCSVNGNTHSDFYFIPKSLRSVTVNGGVISHGAFMNCSFLTDVTLPPSITAIGDKAFYECSGISSIDFPSNVQTLGSYAFYGCTSLETVNVNDSLKKIGDSAFYECELLTEISLPNTVDSIGSFAFYHCKSLNHFDMPTSVAVLSSGMFQGCTSLETVTLGNVANVIGSGAFRDCIKLISSISIPSGVTEIGEMAFYNCMSLSSLTFNGSVLKVIGQNAFMGCKGIETVILPSSVETIGNSAFSGCAGINTLTFGSNIKYIGSGAFSGCGLITTLTIPDSVTEIGSAAFRGCDGLQTLTLPFVGRSKTATLPYEQVFGHIFGYFTDSSSLKTTGTYQIRYNNMYYYFCIPTTLTTVIVTGGYINDSAFRNCSMNSQDANANYAKLTSITLGANVTGIGKEAFVGADNLTTLTFGSATGWTMSDTEDAAGSSINVTASDFVEKIKKAGAFGGYGDKYFKHTA
ncbi:MAG: leucine-rich repeat domain-containing protein [Clostridiales bacterium]|nr:leucine-rich repeat domain-containing protein [Clostridiales bacterium]